MKQKDKTRPDKNRDGHRKKRTGKIAGTVPDASSGRGSESEIMGQPVISHLFFLTKPVKIEMKAMTTNRCYALILLFT
jgi:hypothetical protein